MIVRNREVEIKKLEQFSCPEPNTGCHLWTGRLSEWGYGILLRTEIHNGVKRKKKWYASRYSYFVHNGEFDSTKKVLHKCDTPACINPDHLYLGTDADNSRDCLSRNRHRPGRHIYREANKCLRGHVLTSENTYIRTRDGSRECRDCRRMTRKRV